VKLMGFEAGVLPGAMARSSCSDNAIFYVPPVLWMTPCFHIMGRVARGVRSIVFGDVLKQVVKISNVFARWGHTVWPRRRIQLQQMVHRGRSVMSTLFKNINY